MRSQRLMGTREPQGSHSLEGKGWTQGRVSHLFGMETWHVLCILKPVHSVSAK
jgi:hypothetical protein